MNVDAANREPLLPFAPEIVLPTVRGLAAVGLRGPARPYGFRCSFNRAFRMDGSPTGWWVTLYQFGIDQSCSPRCNRPPRANPNPERAEVRHTAFSGWRI